MKNNGYNDNSSIPSDKESDYNECTFNNVSRRSIKGNESNTSKVVDSHFDNNAEDALGKLKSKLNLKIKVGVDVKPIESSPDVLNKNESIVNENKLAIK